VSGLDEIDWRILDELGENCRISYRELAKRVGLSTSGVMNRVASMQEDGIIQCFMVIPSSVMIGADAYIAIVYTDASENVDEFIDRIGALQETIMVGELASTRGRSYLTTGQYIGLDRLQEIGRYLRALVGVEEVEIHPHRRLRVSDGRRMDLTRHHLLVLGSLRKDARMQVHEIAEETGLSRKRVRRVIRDLQDGGAFRFVTRSHYSRKRMTEVIIRIEYSDYDACLLEFEREIQNRRPGIFDVFFSTTEPVAFAWFICEKIQDADRISRVLAEADFVKQAVPLVFKSIQKSPWLAELKLDEIVKSIHE
jgi:DNA-binding Lrp family transcriptional regulator